MADFGKVEKLRDDYPIKKKGKIEVPSKDGNKGVPPGVTSGDGNKTDIKYDSPSLKGDKGASLPGKAPKRKAPLD